MSRAVSATVDMLGGARILLPLFHIFGRTLEYHAKKSLPALLSAKHRGLLVFIKEDEAPTTDKVQMAVQLVARANDWAVPGPGAPVSSAGTWQPQSVATASQWSVFGPKAEVPNKADCVAFARAFLGLTMQLLKPNTTAAPQHVQLPLRADLYGPDPTQPANTARCYFVSTYLCHGDRKYAVAQVQVNARPTATGFSTRDPIVLTPLTPAVSPSALPVIAPYLVGPCLLDSAEITECARASASASICVLVQGRDTEYGNWMAPQVRPPARTPEADVIHGTCVGVG